MNKELVKANYILYYADGDEFGPLFISDDFELLEKEKNGLILKELGRIKELIEKNKENANRYFVKIANWLEENKEALLENRIIATFTLENNPKRIGVTNISAGTWEYKDIPQNIKSYFIEEIRKGNLNYLYTIDEYLDKDKIKTKKPKMDHFQVEEKGGIEWSGQLFIKQVPVLKKLEESMYDQIKRKIESIKGN